jgi:hypothetical protein
MICFSLEFRIPLAKRMTGNDETMNRFIQPLVSNILAIPNNITVTITVPKSLDHSYGIGYNLDDIYQRIIALTA